MLVYVCMCVCVLRAWKVMETKSREEVVGERERCVLIKVTSCCFSILAGVSLTCEKHG